MGFSDRTFFFCFTKRDRVLVL